MKIPKTHQNFIRLIATGETNENSYLQTISKKSTKQSARQRGAILSKKYISEIEKEKISYQTNIEQSYKESVIKESIKRILHQTEVDAVLCSIIKGELLAEKKITFINKNGQKVTTTLFCKPEHSEILKAIDIYNKRFGSYATEKIEHSFIEQPLFPDIKIIETNVQQNNGDK